MKLFFKHKRCTIWHGDCRKVLAAGVIDQCDLAVADPPYGQTPLPWDTVVAGWADLLPCNSLWVFGTLKSLLAGADEFSAWRMSQDVVWQKTNGTGFDVDRFRRTHEMVAHFYRGLWRDVQHDVPRSFGHSIIKAIHRSGEHCPHRRSIGPTTYRSLDGSRMVTSVIRAKNMNGRAVHPTEKPVEILTPLIEYGCPMGGVVLDPFMGSGSTLHAAIACGRRAIGIEREKKYCRLAAARLEKLLDHSKRRAPVLTDS